MTNAVYDKYQESDLKNLSAGVFVAFCDSLKTSNEISIGGAPQLVGLYRKGNGRDFGVVINDQRYILGFPATLMQNPMVVEWRNEMFERCDGETGQRLRKAARQPRSRNL